MCDIYAKPISADVFEDKYIRQRHGAVESIVSIPYFAKSSETDSGVLAVNVSCAISAPLSFKETTHTELLVGVIGASVGVIGVTVGVIGSTVEMSVVGGFLVKRVEQPFSLSKEAVLPEFVKVPSTERLPTLKAIGRVLEVPTSPV
jgi:hypothetical protein